MEEVDFVCTSKDSNHRIIADEKQLISNKQKHNMVLSLNKSNHFPTDDTPTPTRFLRSCEDIGLFQDLQDVNPFEVTFKKAAEAVKKGETIQTLHIPTLGKAAGEDLHTPHIDLSEAHFLGEAIGDRVERVVRTEADTSLNPSLISSQKPSLPSNEDIGRARTTEQGLPLYVRMLDGSLVQISTIGGHLAVDSKSSDANNPRTIIISTQNVSSEVVSKVAATPRTISQRPLSSTSSATSATVKQKLKAALLKTSKAPIPTSSSIPVPTISLQSSDSSPTEVRKEKKVTSTTLDEDQERRLKTLERNRIAAMRCREKRKKWVADLREKYERMCNTNEVLVKEVTFLRNEVTRLKSALLLAYNQPLTVQDMTAGTVQIITNGKGIPMVGKVPLVVTTEENSRRPARADLKLDVESASKLTVMDLDSPLVRSDEVLSSTAQPTTPNEKLITFPELERVEGEGSEEKMLSSVIQINPNALSKIPSAFS